MKHKTERNNEETYFLRRHLPHIGADGRQGRRSDGKGYRLLCARRDTTQMEQHHTDGIVFPVQEANRHTDRLGREKAHRKQGKRKGEEQAEAKGDKDDAADRPCTKGKRFRNHSRRRKRTAASCCGKHTL